MNTVPRFPTLNALKHAVVASNLPGSKEPPVRCDDWWFLRRNRAAPINGTCRVIQNGYACNVELNDGKITRVLRDN